MLKLQELKKKQQQQQQQSSSTPSKTEESSTPTSTGNETEGTGYILKRQNSKELAEKRRQKSKESVFSLRKSGGTKKG